MQTQAGPQLAPQVASLAHLWEGGRLSPREVTTPALVPALSGDEQGKRRQKDLTETK